MANSIGIQFTIPATDDLPAYTDTLWFDSLSDAADETTVEALKQERYNAWADVIRNPPPAPELESPSVDDALAEAHAALAQATQLIESLQQATPQIEG